MQNNGRFSFWTEECSCHVGEHIPFEMYDNNIPKIKYIEMHMIRPGVLDCIYSGFWLCCPAHWILNEIWG